MKGQEGSGASGISGVVFLPEGQKRQRVKGSTGREGSGGVRRVRDQRCGSPARGSESQRVRGSTGQEGSGGVRRVGRGQEGQEGRERSEISGGRRIGVPDVPAPEGSWAPDPKCFGRPLRA